MRRLVLAALVFALLVSGAALVRSGYAVWGNFKDNAAIRALAEGHEVALREDADPHAVHARILFLAWRDKLAETQELLPRLADGQADLRSDAHFAIANARMRSGYDHIEAGSFEDATPEIELAKSAYREALRAEPGNRDAKVNLELAMRLVRDLPRPLAEGEEDPENQPRQLWTDLPGMPRGAP